MKDKTPSISVIMPLYNKAEFVGEAIESVLNQTFTEWELVIMNDGSTDCSPGIAAEYARKDERIKLLEQPNGGVVAARNNGIAAAAGEYIYPLDADNKISPDALSKLLAAARLGLGDVIYSDMELFGAREGLCAPDLPTRENMIHKNYVDNSALYKKSDWEKYGGYDNNMKDGLEDWEFWLNFIADGRNFYRIPEPLFYYRFLPESRNNKPSQGMQDVIARLKEHVRTKHAALYENPLMDLPLEQGERLALSIPANYPRIQNPKLIMTLLVKNESDIIGRNLEFHKAMGVDGFIVTDNMSTDGSREILQEYKDWILDIIDEPDQNHNQAEWVHRMAALARHKYHADWIINADADEFWHPQSGDLKAEISSSPENMLYVPMCHMLDKGGDWIDNTDMIQGILQEHLAEGLIAAGRLCKWHPYGQTLPKVLVRAMEYTHIHDGNHHAQMVVMHPPHISRDIIIYHFGSRGREHFKRKMLAGGRALERNTKLGDKQGGHWRYFYNGFRNGSLDMDNEYDKYVGKFCAIEIAPLLVRDDTIKRFFAEPQTA
ncbi:MAG: glycosyltransferase [Betaproteobacteria bacterium]|nr:glycosyltransferase [Betaproteobacteria bacterium]